MTNLQVIRHLIGSNADLSDERLSIAAQLAGIDPAAEFDQSGKCALYALAISEIETDKGVKKVTEGGYSVEYADNTAGAIASIATQSGCQELIDKYVPSQPKVRDRSNIW